MSNIKITDSAGNKPVFTQWDVDRKLYIYGASSKPYLHFANKELSRAIVVESETITGGYMCKVPNFALQFEGPMIVSVFLQPNEGYTATQIQIPVRPKMKPEDYCYTENIGYVNWVQKSAESQALIDEIQEMLDDGDLKGDAATITVGSTTTLPAGSDATVTNSGSSGDAVLNFGIPKGSKGDDGVSPSVTIAEITGGHSVTITDAGHPNGQSFNVMDGEDATVDATLSNAGEAADAAATGAVKAMADRHDAELLAITAASSADRFEWQIGYYWNTSGVSKGGTGFARTHKFVAEPGTLIQNLAEDAVTISGVAKTAQMFVHEFNEATWLRSTKLTQGEYVVVGENTNIVGFVYGFAAAQSVTIDQTLIDDNFSVRVVRRTAGGAPTAKIYCLGDSITKGMYTEIGDDAAQGKTDRGWPYWVGLLNNWDVVNLGRSGAGYVNISTDTSESASDVVDNNSFADADYVVLAYGVNDYKASTPATLGSISTSTAGDGTVIGEMMYCIETLGNTKAKNAAIIVMLPMNENRFSNGTLDDNWAFGYAFNDGKTLTDYRDAIRACAEHYNLGVIDPETVCAINRLNIRQCLGDGIHPTKAFYEQMGKTIAACIKAGASAGIFKASGSGSVTVDSALSGSSENPVQNKIIKAALDAKGTYSKPSGGIPKNDLETAVQSSLVFTCTYGTTTNAEIEAAYQAGKEVIVAYSSKIYRLVYRGSATSHTFSYFNDSSATTGQQVSCSGDTWSAATSHELIRAPSSPTTGDFLCWNGSAWAATTLSAWQGGNY